MKITPRLKEYAALAVADGYDALYTTYSKSRWRVGYVFYSLETLERILGIGIEQPIGYHRLFAKYKPKKGGAK